MGQIQFGTDGWRAVIAEGFRFSNVQRLAQAAADFWNHSRIPETEKRVVVGYDRRFLSPEFGESVSGVLAANGLEVVLTPEPTPTPSVSYAVKTMGAVGGVMTTASHNPAIFNGFKLKTHLGGAAGPVICREVEGHIGRSPVKSISLEEGLRSNLIRLTDLKPAHFSAVKKLVDFELIAKSGLRVAHEALFGVGAGCFAELLAGTRCKVTTLSGEHDPLFGGINPEPVEQNYGRSSSFLRKNPHDICVVTDGDADRIGGMDGRGKPLSTHQLICLLLQHLAITRRGRGRVVKALTTTSMVDKMCAAYGLELVETGVGFKYIGAEMVKGGVLLGAEESGGIGLPGHIPERDGIAAGLMILEVLATERKPVGKLIKNLESTYGPHHYGRIDTHFPLEKRSDLMSFLTNHPPAKLGRSPVVGINVRDGVKFVAQDSSWLMLRGSGTEPVLRIYSETSTPAGVRKLLDLGLKLAGQCR